MLCVPASADADLIFKDVLWSQPLTAVSQIKALTDCNIVVKLGRLMHDVDEPEDVEQLCERLRHPEVLESGCVLQQPSNKGTRRRDSQCDYTKAALIDLGLLNCNSFQNT
jgi:hypothetical protein